MREKGNEEGIAGRIFLRRRCAPVHLNTIADALKGIEGQAQRHDKAGKGQAHDGHHGHKNENREDDDIPLLPGLFDEKSEKIGYQDGSHQKKETLISGLVIKVSVGRQQHHPLEPLGDNIINEKSCQHKPGKTHGCKSHEIRILE